MGTQPYNYTLSWIDPLTVATNGLSLKQCRSRFVDDWISSRTRFIIYSKKQLLGEKGSAGFLADVASRVEQSHVKFQDAIYQHLIVCSSHGVGGWFLKSKKVGYGISLHCNFIQNIPIKNTWHLRCSYSYSLVLVTATWDHGSRCCRKALQRLQERWLRQISRCFSGKISKWATQGILAIQGTCWHISLAWDDSQWIPVIFNGQQRVSHLKSSEACTPQRTHNSRLGWLMAATAPQHVKLPVTTSAQ